MTPGLTPISYCLCSPGLRIHQQLTRIRRSRKTIPDVDPTVVKNQLFGPVRIRPPRNKVDLDLDPFSLSSLI